MSVPNIGLCQRGFDASSGKGRYVLRNFSQTPDRYDAYFSVTIVGSPPHLVGAFKHGGEFDILAGELVHVSVTQSDSLGNPLSGDSLQLTLQPYKLVGDDYQIFHFFQQERGVVWAIGDRQGIVSILRSSDYFDSFVVIHSWPASVFDAFGPIYRSMYIDKFGNIIVGSRPSPLISSDHGASWNPLPFKWQDEQHGMLCPFWNITESKTESLLVISEYGDSLADTQPNGSHRGTFWSFDRKRHHWVTRPVDRSFDRSDYGKFNGYFRHIHGYHINPFMPNVHLMFLGDPAVIDGVNDIGLLSLPSDGTPGYYLSQDRGQTWSTEVLVQYDSSRRYNGPCFVTWWPSGKAFITSDTAETGHAYWWGNGPTVWGAPGLQPAIELRGWVDEEASWPETPWMAMAVKGSYETYCTTSVDATAFGKKEVLWRYDGDAQTDGVTGKQTVLAENYAEQQSVFSTLKWLSGSGGNMIPAGAKYFFTSGGRRFPRK